MTDAEKEEVSREAISDENGDLTPQHQPYEIAALTEEEAAAQGLTSDQKEFAFMPREEAQLLTNIALLMVKAGIMMAHPPKIVSTENVQYGAAIQNLINQAGTLSMNWAVAKGLIQIQVSEEPLVKP